MNEQRIDDLACPRLREIERAMRSAESGVAVLDEGREADSLRRHLSSCRVCRRWLGRHGHGLAAEIARLPRSLSPERDLWPDIVGRLPPRSARRPMSPAPWLAAAAILAIGITAGYLLRGFGAAATPPSEAAAEAAISTAVAASDSGDRASGGALATYRTATRELRLAVETRFSSYEPDTRAELEAQLLVIESAIADLEAALAAAPDDSRLEGFLLARYRQQVRLLTTFDFAGS